MQVLAGASGRHALSWVTPQVTPQPDSPWRRAALTAPRTVATRKASATARLSKPLQAGSPRGGVPRSQIQLRRQLLLLARRTHPCPRGNKQSGASVAEVVARNQNDCQTFPSGAAGGFWASVTSIRFEVDSIRGRSVVTVRFGVNSFHQSLSLRDNHLGAVLCGRGIRS